MQEAKLIAQAMEQLEHLEKMNLEGPRTGLFFFGDHLLLSFGEILPGNLLVAKFGFHLRHHWNHPPSSFQILLLRKWWSSTNRHLRHHQFQSSWNLPVVLLFLWPLTSMSRARRPGLKLVVCLPFFWCWRSRRIACCKTRKSSS